MYLDISNIFSYSVICLITNQEFPDTSLSYSEQFLISDASKKRKKEFVKGRVLAKKILGELGYLNFPLLRNEDGFPIWPSGITGSISHKDDICGIALTKDSSIRSLGFDIENISNFPTEIILQLFSKTEIKQLKKTSNDDRQRIAALIFSAKESVFKSQYQVAKTKLSLSDIVITVDISKGLFYVNQLKKNHIKSGLYQGKFSFKDDYVYTGIIIKNRYRRKKFT